MQVLSRRSREFMEEGLEGCAWGCQRDTGGRGTHVLEGEWIIEEAVDGAKLVSFGTQPEVVIH